MYRAVVLLALVVCGCGGSREGTAGGSPTAPPAAPAATSWTVSGQILRAPGGAPVGGAAITFGDLPAVNSDASGNYSLTTTDAVQRPLLISAPGYLTRETSLAGGSVRAGLVYDLIGDDPEFPRTQYLDLARNAYERPNVLEPVRRWTTNPNVYISTIWRDTGAEVRPESLEFLISEIRRVIPLWSAGTLQAGIIETGAGTRPATKGWIRVEFGRSGNWSLLGEDPGQVQFGSEGTCVSMAIVHEFGHAMGYWHTRVNPSIMGGGPGSCTLANVTPNEALIAKVMYSRQPGNLSPDKDGPPPLPPIYLEGIPSGEPQGSGYRVACDLFLRR